jgi:cytochrome c oxidase cbb3-type subunit 3
MAEKPGESHDNGGGVEKDKVIHEYDGIQEYDNELPRWWLYTLYGCVVFAIGYWAAYHSFQSADLPQAAYDKQVAAARAAEAEKIKNLGAVTPEALVTLSKDAATVEKGKQVFASTCALCHRADGGGNVGPNLTDDSWIHGGKPDQIYKTVDQGAAGTAMIAWGGQLGVEKTQAVVAYVLTLKGTNVKDGKAPQGTVEN